MKIRSNGQSPLVNPTRKITAFFTKKITPSPIAEPSPSPSSPQSKSNPKKPLPVIRPSPICSPVSSTVNCYGSEVVGRRIKVFWRPEGSWYEGCVKRFDEAAGQHLVVYDEAEEEMLNLSKVKLEWVPAAKKFRRLLKRRASVVDDDSADEDLGKNAEKDEDTKISKKGERSEKSVSKRRKEQL